MAWRASGLPWWLFTRPRSAGVMRGRVACGGSGGFAVVVGAGGALGAAEVVAVAVLDDVGAGGGGVEDDAAPAGAAAFADLAAVGDVEACDGGGGQHEGGVFAVVSGVVGQFHDVVELGLRGGGEGRVVGFEACEGVRDHGHGGSREG